MGLMTSRPCCPQRRCPRRLKQLPSLVQCAPLGDPSSTAVAASAPADVAALWRTPSGIACYFPLFSVRVSRALTFQRMRAHEELLAAAQLDERRGREGLLLFVSHQWTAFSEPDHTNTQFMTLARFLADPGAVRNLMAQRRRPQDDMSQPPVTEAYDPEQSFLWLDYWSVPQACHLKQRLAILSIAAYAACSEVMLVLAPPVEHADTGKKCNLASWRGRGWCRLEELVFGLKEFSSGTLARVYVLEALGAEVRHEGIRQSICMRNRRASVLFGAFTCCDCGHVVRAGGPALPCDRPLVLQMVQAMDEGAAQTLLARKDVPAWRRLRSTRWARGLTGEAPASAPAFLAELCIPSASWRLEGDMFALHYAAYGNDPGVVAGLLALRADLHCRDQKGLTPLHLAALTDSACAAEALLDAGADVNAQNSDAVTPTYLCLPAESLDVLALLLARRGDPNIQRSATSGLMMSSTGGMSSLHMAAFFGHQCSVNLLLAARADADARVLDGGQYAGCTCKEVATRSGREVVL